MKKRLTLIAFILVILSVSNIKASHYTGAEYTYTYLGGTTYLITYTFYRDCSGIVAPTSINTQINCSSNAAMNFTVNLLRILGTGQEVTNSCSSISTKCSGGIAYGIQEYIYQGTVSLAPCNNWVISSTSCCRNPITTLTGSTSSEWYNEAILFNLSAPGNSSPVFASPPVFIVLKGQPTCLDLGAIDPDGDSLVYSLYAPKKTLNSPVNYNWPYSYTYFLQALNSGISLDSNTGQLCFTPTMNLTSIYGIQVDEYRKINGVDTLIGTIFRDIQLKVISGNNNTPVLSGIDTSLSKSYSPNDTAYYFESCLSIDPITFNIYGFDSDTFNPAVSGNPEQFSISWSNNIPNATFTPHNNGTDSAYATFSWQVGNNSVNHKSCFTATIQDEGCPYNTTRSFNYCIFPKAMLVDIGSDTLICEGESVIVKANADSSTVNYLWSINGSPAGNLPNQDSLVFNSNTLGPGQHLVSIETNDGSTTIACPGVDQIIIDVVYQPTINGTLRDTSICIPQTVTYNAGPGQQYLWTDWALNPKSISQTFTTSAGGIYIVTVNGGVNTRCYDVDTFIVTVPLSPPPFSFGPDVTIGQNQTLVLNMPTVQSPQYWWNTGDTTSSITIDSTFNWINKIVGLTTFGNQCYTSDTIYVFIGSVGMDHSQNADFKIYPNPVHKSLYINLNKDYSSNEIEVYDLTGKLLIKEQFAGKNYELKSVKNLPKGIYLLKLRNKDQIMSLKFVKE